MTKILIISYNALPMDVVSSYRPKAYCDYFHTENIFPTLLTNNWEKDDLGNWKFDDTNHLIKENYENCKILRLSRPKVFKPKGLLSQFQSLKFLLKGDLDIELLNSYHSYKNFLFDHLENNHYDLVLSIYNPHYHLKLAFEIKKKFNIPYVLDFRDLWDNEIVTGSYKPSIKKKLIDTIIRFWWKKWLKESFFFVTTSEVWKEYLYKLSLKTGFIIRNGFDTSLSEHANIKTEKFSIVHFGKIYRNQQLDCFLAAFSRFYRLKKDGNIELKLVGIKKDGSFNALNIIKNFLPPKSLNIIPYLPKNELVHHCRENATLFWLPNFNEDNGQFMVKLYDYLSIGKPIINCPKNGSDLEEVIDYTSSGKSFSTDEEVFQFLNEAYEQFKAYGYVKFNGNRNKINEFHRKEQVIKLSQLIKKTLN